MTDPGASGQQSQPGEKAVTEGVAAAPPQAAPSVPANPGPGPSPSQPVLSSSQPNPSAAPRSWQEKRGGVMRSDGAKIAIIGAVATALAAALITSDRLDSVFDWVRGGSSGETSSISTSATTIATKSVSDNRGSLTLTVPADWGFGLAAYNMPIAGVVDAGAGIRSGKGAGMISADSFDEPSVALLASVDAARRLQLKDHTAAERIEYLKILLTIDDYSRDGCTYVGQKLLGKEGYVGVIDTWRGCHGFADTEFRNMYAISDSGDVFSFGQALTKGAAKAQGEEILSSFAVRAAGIPSGESTKSAMTQYPLPGWVKQPSGDASLP